MGQGALDNIGSLGTGMYLVLGLFFAAARADEALEASKPAGASFASSSTLSFDLIHSYDLMSIYVPITGIRTRLPSRQRTNFGSVHVSPSLPAAGWSGNASQGVELSSSCPLRSQGNADRRMSIGLDVRRTTYQ